MFNHDHMAVHDAGLQQATPGWSGVTRNVTPPTRAEDSRVVIIEPASVSDPSLIRGAIEIEPYRPVRRVAVLERLAGWDEMTGTDWPDVEPVPVAQRDAPVPGVPRKVRRR